VRLPGTVRIAIKIDVDTRIGTRRGIPRLLAIFRRAKVRASFFAVFGPDNSGKAVFRVFRRRGFVGKMVRTNPLKIYGLRTLLYGTVLPAPLTGLAFPDVIRSVEAEGHELGLHSYDHVLWQDHVGEWDKGRAAIELERGLAAHSQVVGHRPRGVAAPGWQATALSLKAQDELGLTYASDTRGRHPFFPVIAGERFSTLQIPGTLPTVDEILGLPGITDSNAIDHLETLLDPDRLNVYTGHAEIEGMCLSEAFESFIGRLARRGVTFTTLEEVASSDAPEGRRASFCEMLQGTVPGRAGLVACQGSPA